MNEESRSDILAATRRAGHRVTEPQLRRWYTFGLLSRPRQRGRGRGKGSESLYPAGTLRRVLAICGLRSKYRPLSEVAWQLWLAHEDLPEQKVLAYLRELAQLHDEILDRLEPYGFDRPETTRRARELVAKVASSRGAQRGLDARLANERVLRRERLETLMRTSIQVMLGTYAADAHAVLADEDSDGVILARSLGLDEARTDRVLDQGPWLPEDPSAQLEGTARLLGGPWVPTIDGLTLDELVRARDRWQAFRMFVVTAGDAMGELLGANVAGLPALANLMRDEDSESAALSILSFVLMSRHPELGFLAGLEQIESVAANWSATALPAIHALQVIRREIPASAEALAPEHLRAAIESKDAFETNQRLLQRIVSENQSEVLEALKRAGIHVDA